MWGRDPKVENHNRMSIYLCADADDIPCICPRIMLILFWQEE